MNKMKRHPLTRYRLPLVAIAVMAAALVAGVVYAQLNDTKTASGEVTVTTASADLYICEPRVLTEFPTSTDFFWTYVPGPDCGDDDSGPDEIIFESLENMRPGDFAEWDLRLKNVGAEDWIVEEVLFDVVETVDPGNDCDFRLLAYIPHEGGFPDPGAPPRGSYAGVFVLGKDGDEVNDNPPGFEFFDFPNFRRESDPYSDFFPNGLNIKVAAGDYEDVRLRLKFFGSRFPHEVGSFEGCDGNEWSVSWEFIVT